MVPPDQMDAIVDGLLAKGVLDEDGGMLFVGPEAERRYGRRHFMELMSVFTSDPQVTVLHGRTEIGTVDPMVLVSKVPGPRRLALAGRTWTVDVGGLDAAPGLRGTVRGVRGCALGRDLGSAQRASCRRVRRVLLGATPAGVVLSGRATERLASLRDAAGRSSGRRTHGRPARRRRDAGGGHGPADARTRSCTPPSLRWHPELCHPDSTYTNDHVVLRADAAASELEAALAVVTERFGEDLARVEPEVTPRAIQELKFADLLPDALAQATLSERLADQAGAATATCRPRVERWSRK